MAHSFCDQAELVSFLTSSYCVQLLYMYTWDPQQQQQTKAPKCMHAPTFCWQVTYCWQLYVWHRPCSRSEWFIAPLSHMVSCFSKNYRYIYCIRWLWDRQCGRICHWWLQYIFISLKCGLSAFILLIFFISISITSLSHRSQCNLLSFQIYHMF